MKQITMTRFFKFASVDEVEERIANIFFAGILFAGFTLILFANTYFSGGVVSWTQKASLTLTYVILSVATVSSTALPYLWNKQSTNRFSDKIYYVFIFIFNFISLGLVLLLAIASSPAGGGLESRLDDIGFLDAAIIIISTSILMEVLADGTAYFMLRSKTKKQPFMGLILIVELCLIGFMTFGNPTWMLIDSTLILGFFLTIGHIVIHFSNLAP